LEKQVRFESKFQVLSCVGVKEAHVLFGSRDQWLLEEMLCVVL